jgi:hypothetical protein
MHHIDLMACPKNNSSFKLHFVFLFGACDVFPQQVKFEFAFELLVEPCGELIEISLKNNLFEVKLQKPLLLVRCWIATIYGWKFCHNS